MLYPLKFIPVFKDYIWGGRNLQNYGKDLPEGKVAESWELCCHSDGMSIVANGKLAGKSLASLIDEYGNSLLGNTYQKNSPTFPLMVKLIDANDRLSVQVHPNDSYALENEGESGKNEMWYILKAKPGANLIYGVRPGVTKEVLKKAVDENRIGECLRSVPVKAGDFVNIPAGMVHAIGEGIVLAEIQQNSNSTYRIYDYDRKDVNGNTRPLHIKKALDVIQFHARVQKKLYEGLKYDLQDGGTATILVANPYFCVELLDIRKTITQQTDGCFHILICISGNGLIRGKESVPIKMGETILIPSCMDTYSISGSMKVIKAYVPDIERDIYERMYDKGFSAKEITVKIDGLESNG